MASQFTNFMLETAEIQRRSEQKRREMMERLRARDAAYAAAFPNQVRRRGDFRVGTDCELRNAIARRYA